MSAASGRTHTTATLLPNRNYKNVIPVEPSSKAIARANVMLPNVPVQVKRRANQLAVKSKTVATGGNIKTEKDAPLLLS